MLDTARRNRVLIVDDSADALRFLTATIERTGAEVLLAKSGNAALQVLERIQPDLILMDALMPGLDGFETTERIKANPVNENIPVIFMTGLTDPKHAVRALGAGGVDYVRKPIDVEELLARVEVHLGNARNVQRNAHALNALGRLLIAVDADGNLKWTTSHADELLDELGRQDRESLPQPVWQAVTRLVEGGTPSPRKSMRVELAGGAIELQYVDRGQDGELLIRLSDLREDAVTALLQGRHALTHREAEVLLWISYGKPNRVISEILEISPRTVNKHLEQVFAKLGVETRSAAAAIAVKTISE
ncbi:DNA-binding response regulator [Pacificimonas flava]|uniref:DNA-binding response regulator n=2 Tax=Pacificimonas TaxID=1960290 RepID=A0A219B268_9SPHN|nr:MULTISPECIES: response regulator [Pacificimonas]MBZ6379631.1 response regulator [Pacificimonas aurantium]OWV31899.1 DNA-binding response regulator [Pacificimonas flava]